MPDCEFNEREFETAVNAELIAAWRPWLVGGLPTIPSQVVEKTKGYDAAYRFEFGRAFFLQYKVAYAAERRTGSNYDVYRAWGRAYFRASLHGDRSGVCDQHNRLVALAASGSEVYYCAPLFHTLTEMGRYARASEVWKHTLLAPLAGVPTVPPGPHSISYPKDGSQWRLHSEVGEPRKAQAAESMFDELTRRRFGRDTFAELASRLRELTPGDGAHEMPPHRRRMGPLAEIDWMLSRSGLAVLVLVPERIARRRARNG